MPNNEEKEQRSLEELNQQFLRMKASGAIDGESPSKEKQDKRGKKSSKTGIIVAVIVCLLLICIGGAVFAIFRGGQTGDDTGQKTATVNQTEKTDSENADAEKTDSENADSGEGDQERESVLTDDEQEKWKTTDVNGEKVYIELNNKISVYSDTRAYIRLINPIFSSYQESIKVYTSDKPDNILYQSEMLAPGTVLEAVILKKPITKEQSAVVEYTIYDKDGDEKGTYPVAVQFVPAETEKAN